MKLRAIAVAIPLALALPAVEAGAQPSRCRNLSRPILTVSTHQARRPAHVFQTLVVYAGGAVRGRQGKQRIKSCIAPRKLRRLVALLRRADFRHAMPRPTCRALPKVARTVRNHVQRKTVGTAWPCGIPMRASVRLVVAHAFALAKVKLIRPSSIIARPAQTNPLAGCTGGPVIFRHEATNLVSAVARRATLVIRAGGSWEYRRWKRLRGRGCLQAQRLSVIKSMSRNVTLRLRPKRHCRARQRLAHELTLGKRRIRWNTPCGPVPAAGMQRLLGEVAGAIPNVRLRP